MGNYIPERLILKNGNLISNSWGLLPVSFNLFKGQPTLVCVAMGRIQHFFLSWPCSLQRKCELAKKYEKFGLNELSSTVHEFNSRSREKNLALQTCFHQP